ncbi:MAG: leucyl aminopeptidase, partial [Proteobacteria bacterium]|nr:leucyl aminopeptidase [Pseudomonadota bacterium]
MTILSVLEGNLATATADTIIVNLFAETPEPSGATGAIDTALGGTIRRLIASGDIKGKPNELTVVYPVDGQVPASRVIVVGLGPRDAFTAERARQAAGAAIR